MSAHIVMAWELGHGYGHVLPLAALTQPLLALGHRVTVLARDLPRVQRAFAGLPVQILSAPFFPGVIAPPQQQNCLSDVIWFDSGGHDGDVYSALFRAWRSLLQLLDAKLLVADSAPLALAAAMGLVPTLSYQNGFHSTDAAGWAIFRDWERVNANTSALRAQALLLHLNSARAQVGLSAVESLAAGFAADRSLIRVPPELDYAAPRPNVRYVGQVAGPGAPPQWAGPALPQRLFAYLRKAYPLNERLISALTRLPRTQVICFHDGIAPELLRPAEHIHYTQVPVDLGALLPQVDAVVCHGGGLQALATQYGKPSLALPLQTEQYLSARRAQQAGCGLLYLSRGERPEFLPLLRQLLSQSDLADNARRIGSAQQAREPDTLGAVLEEIRALLQGRP